MDPLLSPAQENFLDICVYRWVWCWVLVCRAAYTFHGTPDGWCLSVLWSQRGSFLFHLLSSVRAFAVIVIMSYYVNNCSTKCNILGQNLAIGCERVKTEISVDLPGTGHLEEAEDLNLSQLGDSEHSFQVSPQSLGRQVFFIPVSN